MNIAFSKTNSSNELNINSTQSLNKFKSNRTRSKTGTKDQDQEQDEDVDDSVMTQDMMSFSWQIAQGMVSERFFLYGY